MKKVFLWFFAIFFLALTANAQTILSEDGKKLKELDKEIENTEQAKKQLITKKESLLTRYSEDYKDVKATDEEISKIDKKLLVMQSEKKLLLEKKLTQELPNNNILLLKMIVVQNERIIELLEKFTKRE